MVIIGLERNKLCNGCHPCPTIMHKLDKLDIWQCPVCLNTTWHYSGEAIPEQKSNTSEDELVVMENGQYSSSSSSD